MFHRFIFSLCCLLISFFTQAQVIQPAKLAAETTAKTVKVGEVVELVFKATVDKNWYIYSVGFD
ncbi:MAG: hypothetical protein C0490_06075, partial [Marivirga sp.]|nr:hypothetical protein [Marivirga sp.]